MWERCSLFQAPFTNIEVTNLNRKFSRTIQDAGYNLLLNSLVLTYWIMHVILKCDNQQSNSHLQHQRTSRHWCIRNHMLKVLMHGPSSKDNQLENMSPPLNKSIIWDPPVIMSGVNPTDHNRDSEYCLL